MAKIGQNPPADDIGKYVSKDGSKYVAKKNKKGDIEVLQEKPNGKGDKFVFDATNTDGFNFDEYFTGRRFISVSYGIRQDYSTAKDASVAAKELLLGVDFNEKMSKKDQEAWESIGVSFHR